VTVKTAKQIVMLLIGKRRKKLSHLNSCEHCNPSPADLAMLKIYIEKVANVTPKCLPDREKRKDLFREYVRDYFNSCIEHAATNHVKEGEVEGYESISVADVGPSNDGLHVPTDSNEVVDNG
jgi:hypothetical protein